MSSRAVTQIEGEKEFTPRQILTWSVKKNALYLKDFKQERHERFIDERVLHAMNNNALSYIQYKLLCRKHDETELIYFLVHCFKKDLSKHMLIN